MPRLTSIGRRWEEGTGSALRVGLDQLVSRNLRGVWVRGELPTGAAVWVTNHHSWWDVFVASAAMRALRARDVGVMMDPHNLAAMKFLRRVDAVGTDELRTAVTMLREGLVLVIFPEGELRNPGPLGPTRPGAQWLASRAGVPLLLVATRVLLRGHQAAEAYLDIRQMSNDACEPGHEERSGYDEQLRAQLQALDEELAHADPRHPLPGFRPAVRGIRSWDERIAGWVDRG